MLQVGQIKHCNEFPWDLLYLLFLLSMRLSLEERKEEKKWDKKTFKNEKH